MSQSYSDDVTEVDDEELEKRIQRVGTRLERLEHEYRLLTEEQASRKED